MSQILIKRQRRDFVLFITTLVLLLFFFFADVCALVRGRELGQDGADFEAAQGEDSGNYRFVHTTIPRIR